MYLTKKIILYINEGDERSKSAKKNIIGSFANKGISTLLSLIIVPITINYINPTQYGIWLTLSSIVSWINYFDMGLAHGFRNRFAEAQAKGLKELARKYVSTTYAVLILLISTICIILSFINKYLDWNSLLKINGISNNLLTTVFFILICCFCVQIILNILTTLLLADQKPALSATINTIGQFFASVGIYILTKTTNGNLIYLTLAYSGIPCIVTLVASIYMFCTTYKQYAPNIKFVDFSLTPNIINLGIKFFIIQIALLFTFQFTNIIISRMLSPNAVTEYNIAYKYFNTIFLIFVIIITPFWSAFTNAYTKQDYTWMQKVYSKLSKIWLLNIAAFIIMLALSPWIYKICLKDTIQISFSLSLAMGIYILMLSRSNLYMYLINGTGKVTIQMIIYVISAFFSIPAMIFCCKHLGTIGVVAVLFIVYLMQDIFGYIQLKKIINNTANGIWNK